MDIRRLGRDRLPGLSRRIASAAGVAGVLTLSLLATGCSIDRAMRPGSYTVQRGDTLSEIAQRYDIDWHDLARWNHIRSPYRISVGQQLTLKPYPRLDYAHMQGASMPANGDAARQPEPQTGSGGNGNVQPLPPRSAPTVTRSSTSPRPDVSSETRSAPASADNGSQRRANSGGARQPSQAAPDENSIDHATSSAATRATTVKAGGPSADGWQWPASGSLLRAYDSSARRRGIEIGGKVGLPVYAASSGTVVYNGTGLKGYGKLIIIKHDEHYLSAYGFVDKSLVKQGQTVAAGAHIADMGLGPGNKPMLHFEVRRDGDPIDPQKVLPTR